MSAQEPGVRASRSRLTSLGTRTAAAVAAFLVAAVLLAAGLGVRDADAAKGSSEASSSHGRDPAPPTSRLAWLARVVTTTPVHAEPSGSSTQVATVRPVTEWGGDTQLLVLRSERRAGRLWVDVRLQGRPNGRHGWILADRAQLTTTAYRLEISLASKRLTVYAKGRKLRSAQVVIGADWTPTPRGSFAVADRLELDNPRRFLGSWVLPITAYSDVLKTFDGGIGQIAIHGRGTAAMKDPLGSAASHGCVRMDNGDIGRVARTIPTGTPVEIR